MAKSPRAKPRTTRKDSQRARGAIAIVRPWPLPPFDREPAIILANLSDVDFVRFHRAGIPFSASTGKGHAAEYEDVGPSIATQGRWLMRALKRLHWTHTTITVSFDARDSESRTQWIVRKSRT